ncbi:multicilin [Danio rerio]|uniref:Multicilin n=1 Tax=Danio rerio TaxID=7955 RepID=A0A2R8PY68_DANRE|nr:multicilin [Danio rerio]|eukprot:NP_001313426.1 multicilin [Danio rerio]
MQTCFYTPLPCLMDNAVTPVNQSYNEDLLSFATGEYQSTETHLMTHEVSNHTDLDLSLELNRQLHATLRRKQEEISALKETNAHLKNLTKQTEYYATILDALTTSFQTDSLSQCTNEWLNEDHSPEHSWISLLTQEQPSDPSSTALTNSSADTQSPASEVKQHLWSSWIDLLCGDAEDCPTGSKRIRFDNELEQLDLKAQDQMVPEDVTKESTLAQDHHLTMSSERQRVNIFGAFNGFQVFTETSTVKSDINISSDGGKGLCFKTSIRDHSTVKTKVFPHGKAFTSHTLSGSCRFLWVPNES